MRTLTAIFVLASALLVGCGTTPTRGQLTMSSDPDRCLIFVFRPAIDDTGTFTATELAIDGTPIATLGRETFTYADAPPGRHQLAVRDGIDGGTWNAEVTLEFERGKTYFLALWNQAQRTNPGTTLPIILPNGVFIPLTFGETYASGRVVFELVPEDIGREALSELSVVEPLSFLPQRAR